MLLKATIPHPQQPWLSEWLQSNAKVARFTSQPYDLACATTEAAAPEPCSTAASEDAQSGGGGGSAAAAIQRELEERNARLVPLTRWPQASAKLGLFATKTLSQGQVSLPALRARVFEMEAADLDDLQRFLQFNRDGYLLVRGAATASPSLPLLREHMAKLVSNRHGVDYDSTTLQLKEHGKRQRAQQINETIDVADPAADEGDVATATRDVLQCHEVQEVVESLRRGASRHHDQALALTLRSSWARIRGQLLPRKEWTEFYYFRDHEPDLAAERDKWNKRFAREISRRRANPPPRYAFTAWVAVGPTPVDAGGVAVCPGSHHFAGFLHQSRAQELVPMDFRRQAVGMPWVVADLEAGDVLLMDMQLARAFVQNKRPHPSLAMFADSMLIMS